MKWINDSGHIGELFPGESERGHMLASVLARVRYALTPTGELLPIDGERQLKDIRRDRIEHSHGVLEPDLPLPRTGTDVIMFADASPGAADGRPSTVELSVGSYETRMAIWGERRWEQRGDTLVPSEAMPFERMPLTWTKAYGGLAVASEGAPVPYPYNPEGKGYLLSEDAAIGIELPNIEDPEHPITSWDDHPIPVGVAPYPANWGLRLKRGIDWVTDSSGRTTVTMDPAQGLFDRAAIPLSGSQLGGNPQVKISGTTFAPHLKFRLPGCPVELEVRIGDRCWRRDLELEEVVLDLCEGLVELGYRKIVKYEFVSFQQRAAELVAKEPHA